LEDNVINYETDVYLSEKDLIVNNKYDQFDP